MSVLTNLTPDNDELIADCSDTLLEELAGLCEYPTVLKGNIPQEFMSLPEEVISLALETHQRYIMLRYRKSKKLSPYFLFVCNKKLTTEANIIAQEEVVLGEYLDRYLLSNGLLGRMDE